MCMNDFHKKTLYRLLIFTWLSGKLSSRYYVFSFFMKVGRNPFYQDFCWSNWKRKGKQYLKEIIFYFEKNVYYPISSNAFSNWSLSYKKSYLWHCLNIRAHTNKEKKNFCRIIFINYFFHFLLSFMYFIITALNRKFLK